MIKGLVESAQKNEVVWLTRGTGNIKRKLDGRSSGKHACNFIAGHKLQTELQNGSLSFKRQ